MLAVLFFTILSAKTYHRDVRDVGLSNSSFWSDSSLIVYFATF